MAASGARLTQGILVGESAFLWGMGVEELVHNTQPTLCSKPQQRPAKNETALAQAPGTVRAASGGYLMPWCVARCGAGCVGVLDVTPLKN